MTTDSRRSALAGSITTAGVGVLMAGALAAATVRQSDQVMSAASFGGYALVLALVLLWLHRMQVGARGVSRAYVGGFLATIALYAIGVGLLAVSSMTSPILGYAVIVAAPMAFMAVRALAETRPEG